MTHLYIPSQAWFWLVIGTGLFLIAVFSLDMWKDEIDKKREAEYDKLYAEIHHDLYSLPVTSENYDKIDNKIIKLAKLKWKNKEMTNLLDQNFKLRYMDERDKRNKEWLSSVVDNHLKLKAKNITCYQDCGLMNSENCNTCPVLEKQPIDMMGL